MSPAAKFAVFAGAVAATAATLAIPMLGGSMMAAFVVSTGVGMSSAVALRRRNKVHFAVALLLGIACPVLALAAALVMKERQYTAKQIKKMSPAERNLYYARESLKDDKEDMLQKEKRCETAKEALETYSNSEDAKPARIRRMEKQLLKAEAQLQQARGRVEKAAKNCRDAENKFRRSTIGKYKDNDESKPQNVAVLCHRNPGTGKMRFEIPYELSDNDQKKLKETLRDKFGVDINDRSQVLVSDVSASRYKNYGLEPNGEERFTMTYHLDTGTIENNGVMDEKKRDEIDAMIADMKKTVIKESYTDEKEHLDIPHGIFSLRRIGDDAVALMVDGNVVSAAVRGKNDSISFITRDSELPLQARKMVSLMNVKGKLKGTSFSEWVENAKDICFSGDNMEIARRNALDESYKNNINKNYGQYEKAGKKAGRSQRI